MFLNRMLSLIGLRIINIEDKDVFKMNRILFLVVLLGLCFPAQSSTAVPFTISAQSVQDALAIDEYGIPTEFSVYQNYPNPFNPSTTIEFDVATPTNVSLVIYDLTGKEVYSLASGYHLPSRYSVVWNTINFNGESVSSGMYIYQLRTSDAVVTKKLVLLR